MRLVEWEAVDLCVENFAHACAMQAVAFGMGGGLLQKVNRDTLSFATKLSHIVYANGHSADIMKAPTGDASKKSLPGEQCLA